MGKSSVTESGDLGARFDEVRTTLLGDRYSDRLEKPLEYWALPSDRRLPLALLGRKVGDLLATPFRELSATPGIGEKKIQSLVKLLNRATQDGPPVANENATTASAEPSTESESETDTGIPRFDPTVVSEALWVEWRQAVRRAGLENEKLGHLAPSLQRLPTVIWQTPLSHYMNHTVSEIRKFRTHGEKRVRCVLEVFHSVYHRLQRAERELQSSDVASASENVSGAKLPLTGRDAVSALTASWIKQLRAWVEQQLASDRLPSEEELRLGFVDPILEMIEVDCGPTVYRLVAERLGVDSTPRSVRDQARTLGVTRARVYQLLDDCGKVMAIRWPSGNNSLDQLVLHFGRFNQVDERLRPFFGLRELCFPAKEVERKSEEDFRASVSEDAPQPTDTQHEDSMRSEDAPEVPNGAERGEELPDRTDARVGANSGETGRSAF